MKKVFKVFLKIFVIIFIAVLAAGAVFTVDASQAKLNTEKLNGKYSEIEFYDNEGNLIEDTGFFYSGKTAKNLNKYTYNAFIAIEDKRFYSHNGIDVKRMAGAAWENLKTFSFKEGASTITQQLVKNTQLSPEKTLFRKTREIKLALDVEKRYKKEEILDMYLNAIYFGSGCYGIENASVSYFDKPAAELTLNESAALAAMIKAPAKYSPYSDYKTFLSRKDLVLKCMKDQGLISDSEFWENCNKDVTVCKERDMTNEYYSYIRECASQISNIFNVPLDEIKNLNYRVYTRMDRNLQKSVYDILKNPEYYKDYKKTDSVSLILNNADFSVSALAVKSRLTLDKILRQPGSAIKPILVYAPALEYNKISPSTEILDEKTDFEGYSPSNCNDKYYGYVSARECVSKSLNVPAVKVLNATGIDKSKSFARRLGIDFDIRDNSLALALGGFTKGCNILNLAGGYVPFSNGGYFRKPKFIDKITDAKGRVIYSDNEQTVQVMRDDTAYLITDMLKETVKSGTASKLNSLGFPICAKTGTVGNQDFNTDAYNVSYTSENTFCVWMGSTAEDKLDIKVTGGLYPTLMAKDVIKSCYAAHIPSDFRRPESIVNCDIDIQYLKENHSIKLASEYTPEKFIKTEIFSVHYQPREVSECFSSPGVEDAEIYFNQGCVSISFKAKEYFSYDIIRKCGNDENIIGTITGKDGKISLTDSDLEGGKTYVYLISPHFTNKKYNRTISGEPYMSQKIVIPYKLTPDNGSGGFDGNDYDNNDYDEKWWENNDIIDFD